jgi:hypothetical protein
MQVMSGPGKDEGAPFIGKGVRQSYDAIGGCLGASHVAS